MVTTKKEDYDWLKISIAAYFVCIVTTLTIYLSGWKMPTNLLVTGIILMTIVAIVVLSISVDQFMLAQEYEDDPYHRRALAIFGMILAGLSMLVVVILLIAVVCIAVMASIQKDKEM